MTAPAEPSVPEVPDSPPPSLRFRRRAAVTSAPGQIWRARLLVRALAERELRALYKQAVLGVAWSVLTPVALMLVFTIFFQRVAVIDTRGVPYTLFVYLGLMSWNFFSSTLSSGGMSLVAQMHLVNKLNCPREVFPLSYMLVSAFNTVIAGGVLVLLFAVNGFMPRATTPLVILPLLVQIAFTLGVTLIIASVTVYLRDLRHALPILLQLGLLATPIAYGLDQIPENVRTLYSAVNPMGPIIDSYRQTVLYGNAPNWGLLAVGALSSLAFLIGGLALFRRLEMGFADVA